MKKYAILALLAAVLSCACFSAAALAASPLQLSLFNPVQLISEDESIHGLSLGLFYTVNNDMYGANASLVANRLYGDMKGGQWGLVNLVEGECWGYQEGLYNRVDGAFYGWQAGLVNIANSKTVGLQSGLVNTTVDLQGVQFGLVNMTDVLYGLQIGLVNLNASGDPFGFLPIVNFSF